MGRWLPPEGVIQENKTEAAVSFMTQPQTTHVVISTMPYWSDRAGLVLVGGAYRDINTRRWDSFGDHLAG